MLTIAEAVGERQEIGDAQQVACERRGRRDGQSVVHHDFQSEHALAGRRRPAAELEEDRVQPFEPRKRRSARSPGPRRPDGSVNTRDDGQRHPADQQVDQVRVEAGRQARRTQLDARYLRASPRTPRYRATLVRLLSQPAPHRAYLRSWTSYAFTTIVSAILSCTHWRDSPKMNTHATSRKMLPRTE